MKLYKILLALTCLAGLWFAMVTQNEEPTSEKSNEVGAVKEKAVNEDKLDKVKITNDENKKRWSQSYQEIFDSLDVRQPIFNPYEMIPVNEPVRPSSKVLSLEFRLKEVGFSLCHEKKRNTSYFFGKNIKLSKLLELLKIIKRDDFSRVESYAGDHLNHWLNRKTGFHEWFARVGTIQCHVSIATQDWYIPSSVFYSKETWKRQILPSYMQDAWLEEVMVWTRSSIKDMDYFPEAVTAPSLEHLRQYEKELRYREEEMKKANIKKYLEDERAKKLAKMSPIELAEFKQKEKEEDMKAVRRCRIQSNLRKIFLSPSEVDDCRNYGFKYLNDKINEKYAGVSEEEKIQAVENAMLEAWLESGKQFEHCVRGFGLSEEEWEQEWQVLREEEIKSFEKIKHEIKEYLDGGWLQQIEQDRIKSIELRKQFGLE